MPSVSTHVLDGAGGGPVEGVRVEVHDSEGRLVGSAVTDERGRAEEVAVGLPPGLYRLTWQLSGFLSEVSARVSLNEERRYHVPLLSSGHSAVVYLGV
ncbi:MAG TPA: hydroxyisourate hydrolase [Acidimicrobiales bacterium]